jgi:hypothetical protein
MKTIVSLRNFLLLTAIVLVLVAIPVSERLQFDQRIEAFFAPDNPDLRMLERSRSDFGGDEFVVVAWTEKRLFAIDAQQPYPQTLNDVLEFDFMPAVADDVAARIDHVTAQLNAIPGVNGEQTQHLPELLNKAPRYKPARRAMVRMFEGSLVGGDGLTTGILLERNCRAGRPDAVSGLTGHSGRRPAADVSGNTMGIGSGRARAGKRRHHQGNAGACGGRTEHGEFDDELTCHSDWYCHFYACYRALSRIAQAIHNRNAGR